MVECIFTLDYEIYGNGSGSLADLVYEPGERLKAMFERHRVREYWLVEPDGPSVEGYRLSGTRLVLTSTARDGERVESVLLPAVDLRPSDLLPNPESSAGL